MKVQLGSCERGCSKDAELHLQSKLLGGWLRVLTGVAVPDRGDWADTSSLSKLSSSSNRLIFRRRGTSYLKRLSTP